MSNHSKQTEAQRAKRAADLRKNLYADWLRGDFPLDVENRLSRQTCFTSDAAALAGELAETLHGQLERRPSVNTIETFVLSASTLTERRDRAATVRALEYCRVGDTPSGARWIGASGARGPRLLTELERCVVRSAASFGNPRHCLSVGILDTGTWSRCLTFLRRDHLFQDTGIWFFDSSAATTGSGSAVAIPEWAQPAAGDVAHCHRDRHEFVLYEGKSTNVEGRRSGVLTGVRYAFRDAGLGADTSVKPNSIALTAQRANDQTR